MTPKQREAIEAVERYGSQRKAAKALGISRSALLNRLASAQAYTDADPAVQGAMSEAGMQDIGVLHSGWIKTDGASLYFQQPSIKAEPEDIAQRVRAALEGVEPIQPVSPPAETADSLLTLYPLPDAHIGQLSWGQETGEDYDLKIAADRIKSGIAECLSAAPASREAVLVAMGDWLHIDNQDNRTPASKHQLDADGRFQKVLDVGIGVLAATAEALVAKHQSVTVVIQRGNHDETAYLAVLFALAERYRDEPRISVQRKPGEFFVTEWGRCLLASCHGDKAKAERLVMYLADKWPEMWGRTKFRYLFTGHLHHHKSQDLGGVHWEQLRAITAKDAYAASHAYSGRSEMQAITYDRQRGEISRVRVALTTAKRET
jgi:hypothetical protein